MARKLKGERDAHSELKRLAQGQSDEASAAQAKIDRLLLELDELRKERGLGSDAYTINGEGAMILDRYSRPVRGEDGKTLDVKPVQEPFRHLDPGSARADDVHEPFKHEPGGSERSDGVTFEKNGNAVLGAGGHGGEYSGRVANDARVDHAAVHVGQEPHAGASPHKGLRDQRRPAEQDERHAEDAAGHGGGYRGRVANDARVDHAAVHVGQEPHAGASPHKGLRDQRRPAEQDKRHTEDAAGHGRRVEREEARVPGSDEHTVAQEFHIAQRSPAPRQLSERVARRSGQHFSRAALEDPGLDGKPLVVADPDKGLPKAQPATPLVGQKALHESMPGVEQPAFDPPDAHSSISEDGNPVNSSHANASKDEAGPAGGKRRKNRGGGALMHAGRLLTVSDMQAKDLPDTDIRGSAKNIADPYLIVQILDDEGQPVSEGRTETVMNVRKCNWTSTIDLFCNDQDREDTRPMPPVTAKFILMDWNKKKSHYVIGDATLELVGNGTKTIEIPSRHVSSCRPFIRFMYEVSPQMYYGTEMTEVTSQAKECVNESVDR